MRTPSGTELSATIEAWRDENAEDVASLRLAAPLGEMEALLLGTSSGAKGHTFSTYGFPQPNQALSGSGTITGYATLNGIQYLQLESSQVTPGFSGAPVFDEVTKRVVGMVVAIAPEDRHKRQGTTAFAVPSEILRAIVPELQLSERSPYRSLDAFTEADADLFFGRERVVTKLLESLKRNPRFLAVLGPSGSGKSSVVQAGLIPALRNGGLSGSEKWGILSIRPGTEPFEALASAGMSEPSHLVQAASDWLSAHPQNERLLILIDQFEELLVSTPADTRADFVAALADLLDSALDVSVLLTLRDDFYSRFVQDAEPLVDWMEKSQVIIPPTLEAAELRQMIERPARELGLVFASGLVDAILADARTADPSGRAIRSTVLPLLEFALTQLWERRVDGELTHDAYRAMGGVTGGLSQWADRAYYALRGNLRSVTRRVFSELVTLGDETQGIADTRRVRSIAELTAKDGEGTKSVLDALVAARLLVARHDESSGQDTVEIIHETLLREWGLLESWLQDDRQFLLWRESLRAAQAAWQESGQDVGALLRGAPLAEAEGWLEKRGNDLGEAERKYVQECVRAFQNRKKKANLLTVAIILVAIFMMFLGIWGSSSAKEARSQAAAAEAASTLAVAEQGRAEEQARIATANQAAAFSMNMQNDNFALASLLAVQAMKQQDNIHTRSALLSSLQFSPKLHQIFWHHGDINGIAFNPDGTILASGSSSKTIMLWNIETGKQICEPLTGHNSAVQSITFSPDGLVLASAGANNNIRLWDTVTCQQIGETLSGHTDRISTLAFNQDGKTLASGSWDTTIILWDIKTREKIKTLTSSNESRINAVVFSPDGKKIASGGVDIRLWDIDTGEQIGEVMQSHSGYIRGLAFNPEGTILASGANDQSVRLWDVNTSQQIGEPLDGHADYVWSVGFNSDGSVLASGSGDKTVRLWDVNTGQQIGEPLKGYNGRILSVAFDSTGTFLGSGGSDGSIWLWAIKGDQPISINTLVDLSDKNSAILDIAFSPDNSTFASSSDDGKIQLWNILTGQITRTFYGHDQKINCLDFNSSGEIIVSGGDDGIVRLWNSNTGKQIGEDLQGDGSPIWEVFFSPANSFVVSANDSGSIEFWDITTWEKEKEFWDFKPYSLDISPTGSILASGNAMGIITMWDIKSGEPLEPSLWGDNSSVLSLAFSPDGQTLVSSGSEIVFWDVSTRTQTGRAAQRNSSLWIHSIVFSPDGKMVVSSRADEIYLWDAVTGQQIGNPISEHNAAVNNVVFSTDGRILISNSGDNTIHLWDMDIESWKEKACQRAGRNLALQEWQTYFGDEPYQITCEQWPVDEDALAAMDN